ncbi:MAG: triose-phosphate isomerase [Gammaproteobacteria bacterium]|nr:triose-phosphate isomerase [Gammaproteobacteria bacterium]
MSQNSRKPLVAGNWKMNMNRQSAGDLAKSVCEGIGGANTEVLLCPPAILIAAVADAIGSSAVKLGAQNMSEHESGAHTGEISAQMLTGYGCSYVILGHSERRHIYGETDAMVAAKTVTAIDNGITPIVCVGETLNERESGATDAVVIRQLNAVLAATGPDAFKNAVIAYEPVWAIGTGKTALPEQAQAVHAVLRTRLDSANAGVDSVRILYGGSVKADNAATLFEQADIDGGLIGGASLNADEFIAICRATG